MREPATAKDSEQRPSDEPLRICIVAASSGEATGGLASYLRGLADHLSRDCEVSVVARFAAGGQGSASFAAAEPSQILDNGRYQTQIIAPQAAWRPVLRRLSTLVSRPALQPLARCLYRQAYQPALIAAMPAKLDVIHYIGTGWELLGFLALAEARRRGATFTILPAVHPGTWGDSPLDISLYDQADSVFVLSKSEGEHLVGLGVQRARLYQCGLAPALAPSGDGDAFRRRHGLANRPVVLFVGRKDRGKGYHALCAATPEILSAIPDVCLVAIGPDREPPYPDVPAAAHLDLGQANDQEKADALAACDVFCMPSAHESFGIVYVEAWSYSKPVIGGPAPAVRELISDGVNGYCVAQDKDAIAAALIRLLREPARRQELGSNGKRAQEAYYTWEIVTQRHLEVFTASSAAERC